MFAVVVEVQYDTRGKFDLTKFNEKLGMIRQFIGYVTADENSAIQFVFEGVDQDQTVDLTVMYSTCIYKFNSSINGTTKWRYCPDIATSTVRPTRSFCTCNDRVHQYTKLHFIPIVLLCGHCNPADILSITPCHFANHIISSVFLLPSFYFVLNAVCI